MYLSIFFIHLSWLKYQTRCGCLNLDEKKDPVQLNRGESIDVRELAKGLNWEIVKGLNWTEGLSRGSTEGSPGLKIQMEAILNWVMGRAHEMGNNWEVSLKRASRNDIW